MPQLQLPMFPAGATEIAAQIAVQQKLCAHLDETETVFPGTGLRLVYEVGSA